jgi:hypothetical protein
MYTHGSDARKKLLIHVFFDHHIAILVVFRLTSDTGTKIRSLTHPRMKVLG